jgi:hypothetical protein
MWRAFTAATALAIAGCAQVPPSPQEIAGKKMEPVPGKAVVYIVQDPFGVYSAGLTFDDGTQITTWPGTFYRWETRPGTRTIKSSDATLNASMKLPVEAGKVYFVEHWVTGIRGSTTDSRLQKMNDKTGRQLVTNGTLCCRVE